MRDGRRKRARDPEASRRRLLDAGVKVFSERGLDGGSVSMIARTAQINRRMLYHYFGSKDGLYRASICHVYQQLSSTEVELADMLLPAEELLARLIRAYYGFLASHPDHVRLLTWENLRLGRATRAANLSSFKAPIIEALRIALDRGRREGHFRADVDERQLLISCMALSFFYFSNRYTLGQALRFDLAAPKTIEKRIAHVVSLLLDGIRVRNGRTAAEFCRKEAQEARPIDLCTKKEKGSRKVAKTQRTAKLTDQNQAVVLLCAFA